jgi:predicted transcriptional regulator
MSPSSFKGKALSEMKKQSDPGKDPLLLIDPKGEMRKKLGVEKENTIVLVYDKKGKCVHEERGKPSQKSAFQIWKALK